MNTACSGSSPAGSLRGRHEGVGPTDETGVREASAGVGDGQPEVADLRAPSGGEPQVTGF